MTEFLTAEEVAKMLRMSRSWVCDHASTRKKPLRPTLPAVKFGGAVRFRREAVEEWVREMEREIA